MEKVTVEDLKKLYLPSKNSHKGENGKLTIIGGSRLFHGASLWALKVASRIVDMVFYASVPENNQLTQKLKSELYDFIAIPRDQVENYIEESDAVLIGPGLVRTAQPPIPSPSEESSGHLGGVPLAASPLHSSEVFLGRILSFKDEGEQTYWLTKYLLNKYPNKKWVIDAGSLQMMEPEWLKRLNRNVIITPHKKELEKLFSGSVHLGGVMASPSTSLGIQPDTIRGVFDLAKEYNCTILLKGPTDIICSPEECKIFEGGNPGMTKGGTGDVLAGLVAALACKNDLFQAACAASFINKRAGEKLAGKVGPYFNASDLVDQIPETMTKLLL